MEAIYINAQYPEAKLVTINEEEMLNSENAEYIELKPVHFDMVPKLVQDEEETMYESYEFDYEYAPSEPESNSSSCIPTTINQTPPPVEEQQQQTVAVTPQPRKILEKTFKCDACDKMFSTNAKLKIHYRIHTGDKPFKCTECGKGFLTKHHLKMHGITHSGEKPYSCNICGKSFGRNYSLTVHKKAHLGLKPCKCQVCGKSFRQKVSLKAHMKTHSDKITS